MAGHGPCLDANNPFAESEVYDGRPTRTRRRDDGARLCFRARLFVVDAGDLCRAGRDGGIFELVFRDGSEYRRARDQLRPAARHGTSASQGKFTLQLNLRRQLQALGFAVGQLGTEPHAELFGMDACFPCGYASPLRIPLQYYPAYLDAQMRAINAKKPDIILVGSQSGTIPYDIHHPRTHSLGSLAFLMGTRPDACVLVVNSIDANDYIRDTLDALRGVAKTRVLALAMSDKAKHPREIMGRTLWTTGRLRRSWRSWRSASGCRRC